MRRFCPNRRATSTSGATAKVSNQIKLSLWVYGTVLGAGHHGGVVLGPENSGVLEAADAFNTLRIKVPSD